MRRLTLILLASFGPATFTCFLPALESLNQAPAAQSEAQHKISINSDLVVLPVTVKDKNGNLVAGLELSDFRIFDDELEQTIEVFTSEASIVIAARTILALKTIPSREVKPGQLAVVTVGYIHAGNKNNIIPDEAELGLTVRTYKADVRKQVLAAIERITKAEAVAAGAPREPTIEHYEATDSVFNDPSLAARLKGTLESAVGKDNVVMEEPVWSKNSNGLRWHNLRFPRFCSNRFL